MGQKRREPRVDRIGDRSQHAQELRKLAKKKRCNDLEDRKDIYVFCGFQKKNRVADPENARSECWATEPVCCGLRKELWVKSKIREAADV